MIYLFFKKKSQNKIKVNFTLSINILLRKYKKFLLNVKEKTTYQQQLLWKNVLVVIIFEEDCMNRSKVWCLIFLTYFIRYPFLYYIDVSKKILYNNLYKLSRIKIIFFFWKFFLYKKIEDNFSLTFSKTSYL